MSKYNELGVVMIPSAVKAGKLYSVLPENGNGDFTFDRSTTATRVNKDGLIETVAADVPRLDYPLIDGVVQDCPALLLEPSRTNLITYSEDFTQSALSNATITPNLAISPDGTLNADKIIESATTSTHYIRRTITTTDATSYAITVFAKAAGRSDIRISRAGGSVAVSYNLTNGTLINGGGAVGSINYLNNGWYKCSMVFDTNSTSTQIRIELQDESSAAAENYLGDGTSGVYLWGAQLELGSYPTSYIPTSNLIVTRNADVCNSAGTSAEFNDSEGVLYAEIAALADDISFKVLSISDGTTTNNVGVGYRTASNVIYTFVGTTINSSTNVTVSDITLNNKVAVKYKSGSFAMWINGFEQYTNSTAFSLSGMDELSFDNGAGNADFYGKAKELATFKEALTDSELEALTSWDSFNDMAVGQLYTIR